MFQVDKNKCVCLQIQGSQIVGCFYYLGVCALLCVSSNLRELDCRLLDPRWITSVAQIHWCTQVFTPISHKRIQHNKNTKYDGNLWQIVGSVLDYMRCPIVSNAIFSTHTHTRIQIHIKQCMQIHIKHYIQIQMKIYKDTNAVHPNQQQKPK